jgi:AraC-like DNA-binding protein
MDILAQVLDRVRLGGTLLFHFELGHPWNLALPARPYALFHYLSRGSATLALERGQELQMTEGDFVVITRGEPHVFYSDRQAKPLQIVDLDRSSPRLGVVRHGGRAKPLSTMICGNFTVSRPLYGSVLEILPPVLLLKPTADGGWLEAILRRMVSESALERPGQRVALSRLTEVLFVEVLRSWIASLSPGQGGWLGAISDPHIGPALKLIHENPERPWTLSDLGHRVGLGRSVFSARFTKLVGQSMHRYVIERRMAEAAFLLETSDEAIARIASRVGYETAAAFSKLFHRHHGLSPGRYRAAQRPDGGQGQPAVPEVESLRPTSTKQKSGKR